MQSLSTISEEKINRPYLILGYIFFIVLFTLSILFFKERILFSDSAFQFFKIANFETLNIEASRYGAILPQIPVLLAIKAGINLKWLVIIYSVSFILLYFLIFLCCVHLLKNIPAAIAVIMILILCVSRSFFHPVTETHQGLVFSVLVYAILQYSGFRNSFIKYVLATIVIILSFFAHPVAIYPLAFIIGYVAIDKQLLRVPAPYILLFIVGVLAIGKVVLTNENSYEGKFFSELLKSPAIILDLPHAYSTKFFIKRIFGLYFWLAVLELTLITYLISKKEYVKLFWQLTTSGLFFIITLLTYNHGDSDIMMERAFMPLAFFVTVPLLKETLKNSKQYRFLKLAVLTIIFLIGITRIYMQGIKYQERTKFNIELLEKTAHIPNQKFIIERKKIDKYFPVFWSFSFETLLLSTITEETPTQTIFPTDDVSRYIPYTKKKMEVFLGTDFWIEWKIEDLNPKYFNLTNKYPYTILKTDDL